MSEEVKEEIEALMSIYEDDMEGEQRLPICNALAMLLLCLYSVLEESPNYVISMHVRSMNDNEDCPTLQLKLTYPKGYPEEMIEIEFDDDHETEIEPEDLNDLVSALNCVVR